MIESLAKCIGILFAVICIVLLDLWFCSKLWVSILVPIFGLPTLTMKQIFWVKFALWFIIPTRIVRTKS